jgi:Rrf2 family transcriptional regulator, nitric oxide-sensitive transcriptional repressor
LRAAVYLADQAPNPRTTEQIANVTKVPQAYLSKVMQSLSRAGLVNSQRGLRGGFALARPTEAITILEVVNAVDPIQRIQACPLGIPTHGTNLCALHRRLDQALEAVERAFRETTLAEVLAEPSKSMPLCSMPNEILVQLG